MHPYLLCLLLFQEGCVLSHRRIVALCAGNRVERGICDPVLGPRNTNADAHPRRDGLQQEERHLTENMDGGRSDMALHTNRSVIHTYIPARGQPRRKAKGCRRHTNTTFPTRSPCPSSTCVEGCGAKIDGPSQEPPPKCNLQMTKISNCNRALSATPF